MRRVLRRKRQINSIDNNELPDPSSVPIYDQAYGVNLKVSPGQVRSRSSVCLFVFLFDGLQVSYDLSVYYYFLFELLIFVFFLAIQVCLFGDFVCLFKYMFFLHQLYFIWE